MPRLGEMSSPDMYIGATVGELGCWVDTAVTRMVQTGVEHSRVPDMGGYLSVGTHIRPVRVRREIHVPSSTEGAPACRPDS